MKTTTCTTAASSPSVTDCKRSENSPKSVACAPHPLLQTFQNHAAFVNKGSKSSLSSSLLASLLLSSKSQSDRSFVMSSSADNDAVGTNTKTKDSLSRKLHRAHVLNLELKYKQVQSILGLQVMDLLTLLQDEIPHHCGIKVPREKKGSVYDEFHQQRSSRPKIYTDEERALLEQCRYHVQRLLDPSGPYQRSSTTPSSWPHDDLEDMASILKAFLDESSRRSAHTITTTDSRTSYTATGKLLCPALLVKIHTNMGLILQITNGADPAIEALQKALWIQHRHAKAWRQQQGNLPQDDHSRETGSSQPFVALPGFLTPEEIGKTSQRLAMAYAEYGNQQDSRSLLHAALSQYEKGGRFGKYHPLVLSAQEALLKLPRRMGDGHHPNEDNPTYASLVSKSPPRSTSSPSPVTRLRRNLPKDLWSSLPTLPIFRIVEEEDNPESLLQKQQRKQKQQRPISSHELSLLPTTQRAEPQMTKEEEEEEGGHASSSSFDYYFYQSQESFGEDK